MTMLPQEHGAVMFHQSGGCCNGSSPMCFAADDLGRKLPA
jgi:uncharacterized protein